MSTISKQFYNLHQVRSQEKRSQKQKYNRILLNSSAIGLCLSCHMQILQYEMRFLLLDLFQYGILVSLY